VLDADRYSEDDVMPAIDAGAEDVQEEGDKMRILSEPTDLTAVKAALEAAGIEIDSAALETEPKSTVELTGKDAERMIDLLDVLDDQDDVDQVYANFDIPESVLEQLAA
jgi:transcriptional/translational regulatory protein YebC/TACO1